MWNNAKTRFKHLVELRAMILGLRKQIETQGQTIVYYQDKMVALQCKIHDLKTLVYVQHINKELQSGLIGATEEYLKGK
jgi:hypothetical protein